MARSTEHTEEAQSGFSREWFVLAGVSLIAFSVTAYQIVPASILPIARETLGIGAFAAGWLVSASLAAQAVTNVPIGVAIDRTSNWTIITLATLAMLVSGPWAWWAANDGSFWLLIAAIALGGAAIAGIITAGANLIGGIFPQHNRATAVAIYLSSPALGFTTGHLTGPHIARFLGWEYVFLVFAGCAGVAFVLFSLSYRGLDSEGEEATIPSRADFVRLFKNPHVWTVCLLGFMAYSLYLFLNSWMPSYLADVHGLSLVLGGAYAALFPAVGIIARATGGIISDRLFAHRRRPVALITFAVTLPILVVLVLLDIPIVIAVLLLPAGFFVQLGIGLFYTYAQEVVTDQVTGTALAMLGFISFTGAFSAPVIAGGLIDLTGSFFAAFVFSWVLAIGGIALAMIAPEPNPA